MLGSCVQRDHFVAHTSVPVFSISELIDCTTLLCSRDGVEVTQSKNAPRRAAIVLAGQLCSLMPEKLLSLLVATTAFVPCHGPNF